MTLHERLTREACTRRVDQSPDTEIRVTIHERLTREARARGVSPLLRTYRLPRSIMVAFLAGAESPEATQRIADAVARRDAKVPS